MSAVAPQPLAETNEVLVRADNMRRLETRLWLAQRITAVILAVCVVVHLVTIIYAVRHGLTADVILGRLRGSTGWLVFYLVFVASTAVHASIGLRAVAAEWLGWNGRFSNAATFLAAALLLALGLRAIAGLFGGAA